MCLVYKPIKLSAQIPTGEFGRRACCNSSWDLRCSWWHHASGQVVTEGRVITISLSEFPPRTNTAHETLEGQSALENLPLSHRYRPEMYIPHFSTRLRIRIHTFRDVTKYSLVEIFLTLRRKFLFPSSGLVTSFIIFEDWADCFSIRSIYRYATHNDVSDNNGPYIQGWSHKVTIL